MKLKPYTEISRSFFQGEIPGTALPPDTVFSLPVPAKRGGEEGEQLEAVFLYRRAEEGMAQGPRPFAWALLSARTGELALFSLCSVMDFISSDRYPMDEPVPLDLPKRLSAKKHAVLTRELLEAYEKLRTFAFSENLSREEVAVIVTYKERFLSLVHTGHYPFYHALSPEFFHWLRLPLPQMKAGRMPKDMRNTREYQYQLLILENLQQLVQQFHEKIERDEGKDKLFDQLHDELQVYKNGMLDALTRPMELDVIGLIDSTRRTVEAYRKKTADEEHYKRLLDLMEGMETDLRDILYRHGVEPYTLYEEKVQVPRQKVVTIVPTADRSKDKLVARRLASGWEKDGRTVRPERVAVYVYNETAKSREPGDAGTAGAQSEVTDG